MVVALCLAQLCLHMRQPSPQVDAPSALAFAETQLRKTIETKYREPDGLHYRESFGSDKTAFLWSQSVTLSALARGLAENRHVYQPLWETARRALDSYWSLGNPGGYAVLPHQRLNPERFYDDNVWIVWAFLDAYRTTRDESDLNHALKAYAFVVSGKDSALGGGIYWQERKKTEKNACINAPAAAVAFQLFEITKDKKYLDMGNELLDWTHHTLQDTDGLLFDNISITGKLERTKWTYNSACYIRALVERYQILHNPADEIEALRVLSSAQNKWIDPQTHLLKDPGPFGQHLLDAMFEASRAFNRPELAATATQTILSVLKVCPDSQHLYGEYWNRKPHATEDRNLKNVASVLRSVLSAEISLKGR